MQKIIAIDVETSGMVIGNYGNPVYNDLDEEYQILSIGMVSADENLDPVEERYIEIAFKENSYVWSDKAQEVHGLSKEHLKLHGASESRAAYSIKGFIERVTDGEPWTALGHNVAAFDLLFLQRLFKKYSLDLDAHYRSIDTSTLGWAAFDQSSSDKLFETIGLVRHQHNALEDAHASLTAARRVKGLLR